MYDYDDYNRKFRSEEALHQYRRDAPFHRDRTPLDSFFAGYVGFDYDPKHPPSWEMTRLQRGYGWDHDDHDAMEAWSGYLEALMHESEAGYGTDNNDLNVWHRLCCGLRVHQLPETCAGCQQVSRVRLLMQPPTCTDVIY